MQYATARASNAPATDPRARILIVDDEDDIGEFMRLILSKNFECAVASSAASALRLVQEKKFDVVFSDVNMPGIDGLQLTPLIKHISPDTVVVIISGQPSLDTAISATRVGAFDYLTKPFEPLQLLVSAKRALHHHNAIVAKRFYEAQLENLVTERTAQLDRALGGVEDAYRLTLQALTAALETRDAETHGHSERVVAYSLQLGRSYGLDGQQMKALEYGSLLHDIGKIGVPDAILRKPGKLNEDEWSLMRQHPLRGKAILAGIKFLEGAARVVAQHHEKWDGSGYPLGLRGEEIDLCARIFAVADAFDAMTSDRVYKTAQSHQHAAEQLQALSGSQFDPAVVGAFMRVPLAEWKRVAESKLIKPAP
ncbi:MAG TPA: HD domain-containing phosphohydrolase, partial [Pyrinomonadaceae bacterium]|nr:HD domain-containing phosphohydrolase [Pyrinomonadaceae bacterium]